MYTGGGEATWRDRLKRTGEVGLDNNYRAYVYRRFPSKRALLNNACSPEHLVVAAVVVDRCLHYAMTSTSQSYRTESSFTNPVSANYILNTRDSVVL